MRTLLAAMLPLLAAGCLCTTVNVRIYERNDDMPIGVDADVDFGGLGTSRSTPDFGSSRTPRDSGDKRKGKRPGDLNAMILRAIDDGATTEDIQTIIRTGKPFKPPEVVPTSRRRQRQGVGESILTGPGGTTGGAVAQTLLGGAF